MPFGSFFPAYVSPAETDVTRTAPNATAPVVMLLVTAGVLVCARCHRSCSDVPNRPSGFSLVSCAMWPSTGVTRALWKACSDFFSICKKNKQCDVYITHVE